MSTIRHRRFFIPFLAGLMACIVTFGCNAVSSNPRTTSNLAPAVTMTVSAAASLQDVLEAISPQFQAAHPDITVDYNFGSSGALQQQIEQGAPTDVFFSASTQQMDALAKKRLILPESRQNLVTNRLVLITSKTSTLNITDFTQLKDANFRHLAVGEFRSVPAGQYAEQVFAHMGLLEPLRSKFVFGNNVRSSLSAVESENAELGVVYATDAALSNRVKVLATAPAGSHKPILYPIAIINSSSHPDEAQTFMDFLTTNPVQKTFEEFGFGPIPSTP